MLTRILARVHVSCKMRSWITACIKAKGRPTSCPYIQVRSSWCNGRLELRHRSLSRLPIFISAIGITVTRWVVDKDESAAVRTDLTIPLSPRCVVSLCRLLHFWRSIRPWFTHSCQHRPMIVLLRPKWRANIVFYHYASIWPIAHPWQMLVVYTNI